MKIFKSIFNSALQGLFWLLPIVAITFIAIWLFEQVSSLIDYLFGFFGFDPKEYEILWTGAGVLSVLIILSIVGGIASTKLASTLEKLIIKIPFYSTIKDIVGIFNSSKKDKHNVLVVAIKGFTHKGYNIGLMYSTKESIIKDHYTITLSMSPIPNGGFMFEVHKDDILVIEDAKFNDNLNYLLSMGTKSIAEILNQSPTDNLIPFSKWQEQNK